MLPDNNRIKVKRLSEQIYLMDDAGEATGYLFGDGTKVICYGEEKLHYA